jgi:hypothetical protein
MSGKKVVGGRVKDGASDLNLFAYWKRSDGVGRGMPLGTLFAYRKDERAAPSRQRPFSFHSRLIESRSGVIHIDQSSFSRKCIDARSLFVKPYEEFHEPGSRECPRGAERK